MGVFVLVLAFVAIVVVVMIAQARAAAERREELQEFAQRTGFQMTVAQGSGCVTGGMFGPDSACPELMTMFGGFQPFGQGYSRRTDNVLIGEKSGCTFYLFDYRYTTGGGKNSQSHSCGIAAVRAPLALPGLDLRPEGFFDKIGQAIGFKDLQFESAEFNQRYHVNANDERFARDLLDPAMIEFLMRVQTRHWELGGPFVLLMQQGFFSPSELDTVLGDLEGFLAAIPLPVRQATTIQASWTSPWDMGAGS